MAVIEILSPGSQRTDRVAKLAEYAEVGIRHYVVVDPEGPISEYVLTEDSPSYRLVATSTGSARLAFGPGISISSGLDDARETERRPVVAGYVVVFEGDDIEGYSVYSPDLPGVVAAGGTRGETEQLEAMLEHVRALREEGHEVPEPSTSTEVMVLDEPKA